MICITGLGSVSAAGIGRAALEAGLARGVPRLREVDPVARPGRPGDARRAALVDARAVDALLPPLEARRMSPPSKYAVVAARQALEDAGLAVPEAPDDGFGVFASTVFGPSSFTQRLIDQILDEGPPSISPMLFPECVANAPAARVALACRAAGPNLTLVQGEAGPLRAAARAAAAIASGRTRAALAGAVEEMTPLVHAILDRFGALSRPDGDEPERARPFDRDRDGVLAAEGATWIVLEDEAGARGRGARPLARVRGSASAFDASAPPNGWGRGAGSLARALAAGLDRAGVAPGDVDLVVSGASGSRAGDRLEGEILRAVWGGSAPPPVIAPKSWTGEYGGAFLGAAVLAAAGAPWAAASYFDTPDPQVGIAPDRGARAPRPPRTVLVSGLAAGGAASWLLLERA